MSVLDIVLVVLAAVAVWAVAELAVTLRRTRRQVEELTSSANEVIQQAQPVVAKLDGIVDELEPAAKQLGPLAGKADVTLDAANEALGRVNGILEDVSSVSGTASSVSGAVSRAAESAVSGVASVVSRIRGAGDPEPARLADQSVEIPEGGAREDRAPERYVDYGEVGAPSPAAQDSQDQSE